MGRGIGCTDEMGIEGWKDGMEWDEGREIRAKTNLFGDSGEIAANRWRINCMR
ncbi:hypothetical protein X777_14572 [Ooceraea biroi]|uniref:Uncharacterized protein n=1 Tax=Ooceraea biroi TaxID=2015173 RepID=A0A026WXS6_OOCBI|nr:hypothetical protein X777_14572 [Ooceraea biroi]